MSLNLRILYFELFKYLKGSTELTCQIIYFKVLVKLSLGLKKLVKQSFERTCMSGFAIRQTYLVVHKLAVSKCE